MPTHFGRTKFLQINLRVIVHCVVFAPHVKSFASTGNDLFMRFDDDRVEVLDSITHICTHRITAAKWQFVHLEYALYNG